MRAEKVENDASTNRLFFVIESELYKLISFILDWATEVSFYDIATENQELSKQIKYFSNVLNKIDNKKVLGELILEFPTELWKLLLKDVELIKLVLEQKPEVLKFFKQELINKGIAIDCLNVDELEASIENPDKAANLSLSNLFGLCRMCSK